MKSIWLDLKSFIKEDFSWKTYAPIMLLTAFLIFLSYGYGFEKKLYSADDWSYQLFFPVFFLLFYFVTVWIKSGMSAFKQKEFVVLSSFFIVLMGVSTGFLGYRDWVADLEIYESYWLRNLLANSKGSVIILGGMALIYLFREKKYLPNFYGFSLKKHSFAPYLLLIAMMIPLILWAATQSDFLSAYPSFKPWRFKSAFGLSTSTMAWIYEFFYLTDFIRVEALFRGALIIGLTRFIGKDTVITMAALYCVFHFSKPLGETISSFFGGYLLGVIALKHNNIIGGCIVHVGIAAMMDGAAHLARFI